MLTRSLSALLVMFLVAPAVFAQEVETADNIYVGDGLVYFSLRTNEVVADDDRTDTNWDILINGVEIHANRAGLLLETTFDDVSEAPLEGMSKGVVKTAGGDSWYNYDMTTHQVSPKADRTFVMQLADDSYAKMEVVSYYHRITEEPRYVSLRFVVQGDGSRTLGD